MDEENGVDVWVQLYLRHWVEEYEPAITEKPIILLAKLDTRKIWRAKTDPVKWRHTEASRISVYKPE